MKIDVLLVEGGRDEKHVYAEDLQGILAGSLKVQRLQIDDHGWMWWENAEGMRRVNILANRMILLDQDEFVIGGGLNEGIALGKVWPLIGGYNFTNLGLKSVLEFAGVDMVGSESAVSFICQERVLAKKIFTDLVFDDLKSREILLTDWEKNYANIEDEVRVNYKFPLEISYGSHCERISLFENFANMVFKIFEEGYGEVTIKELGVLNKKYMISFIGRQNFLPSKLLSKNLQNELSLAEDKIFEREIQDFVINFVKNYDVCDYGMFIINRYIDGWKIAEIDLSPPVGVESDMAMVWKKSGFDYQSMVKKIIFG